MAEISAELLELLACPVPECRGGLRAEPAALVCVACGRRYRMEDRWPVLIPEEAEGGPADDRVASPAPRREA